MANQVAEADQKRLFQEIRNFLAGRMLGATRDQALLEEVMKCLFTRKRMLLDGLEPGAAKLDDLALAKLYRSNFIGVPGIFERDDQILLDPVALRFVDDRLARIDLFASDRDPVGDLYETFMGAAVRGQEGQFFTPQNAGRWLVEAVDPSSGERVIDPACGAGGFLVWAAQHASGLGLVGVEKDDYLAALARARTSIIGAEAKIHCANSLSFENGSPKSKLEREFIGEFDVVLANPPFGKNIRSVSEEIQGKFDLGFKWKQKKGQGFIRTPQLASKVPPQVLFIERIVSVLKDGGRAGIVVPESMLASRSYGHVVQYLREHACIKAVVGMPEALFKSSGKGGTHTKTSLLIFEKGKKQTHVFMAEAKWCGHDSRGRPIPKDDLPRILKDYRAGARAELEMSYRLPAKELSKNILSPRYHEPTAEVFKSELGETHDFVLINDLIDEGVLEIRTGNEVGKLAYGTGSIPFVRTSDMSNWEIKIDPKHCVSEEIYDSLRAQQDVQRGDILMVRDGTYLIGSCAIVTAYDEKIVYQSHLLKIRSLDHDRLSPFLLLALLSSDPVQKQIRAKTFTQDIIDSLGNRLGEIFLPIPKSLELQREIVTMVERVILDRVEARELSRRAKVMVVDPKLPVQASGSTASEAVLLASPVI